MDRETVEAVKDLLTDISDEHGIDLNQIIIFGSRAREDYTEDSDIDIVIISKDFGGKEWYKRGQQFHFNWDYENLPEPEIICLTPEEYDRRSQKVGDVVKKASDEGIKLT